jgi:hypothetical protein
MDKRHALMMFVALLGIAFLSAGSACATTFPVGEAGISAYVHVNQTIDLEQASGAFTTLDVINDTYIIGTVTIPNYGYTSTPHVYVARNGWIVAYYPNSYPASYVVQWNGVSSTITTTTLEDGVYSVCNAIGTSVARKDIKYYDFRYTNATEMMIIAKRSYNHVWGTFYQTVPETFGFYEGSYSYYSYYRDSSQLRIDGVTVDSFSQSSGTSVLHRDATSKFEKGKSQYIQVYHNPDYGSGGASGVAVVLIYSPP